MERKNVKAFFLFLLMLYLPHLTLHADKVPVTIEAAQALEKENKTEQALAVYEEWLKDHANDPGFPAVLFHCGDLKKNPLAAIELFIAYEGKIASASIRKEVQKQIGILYALLGEYQNALVFLNRAFQDIAPGSTEDPWMVKTVFLFIATGEIDRAYELIKQINPVIKTRDLRGELNYALLEIYLVRNDMQNAQRAFSILKEQFASCPAWPRALARLCIEAVGRKDEKKAREYFDLLKKDFPGSLDLQAAASALEGAGKNGIVFICTPYDLLRAVLPEEVAPAEKKDSGIDAPPEIPEKDKTDPEPAPEPTTVQRYRIQVGSYTMRENAEYVVWDLKGNAFDAEIVAVTIKEKTYYRVFVGNGLSEDDAQTLLARLRDKGFSGYLFPLP